MPSPDTTFWARWLPFLGKGNENNPSLPASFPAFRSHSWGRREGSRGAGSHGIFFVTVAIPAVTISFIIAFIPLTAAHS